MKSKFSNELGRSGKKNEISNGQAELQKKKRKKEKDE